MLRWKYVKTDVVNVGGVPMYRRTYTKNGKVKEKLYPYFKKRKAKFSFFAFTALLIAFSSCSCSSSVRSISGEVFTKNLIRTDDGEMWGYQSNLPVKTYVRVYFDTHGTPSIFDDDIISVKEW